MRLALYQPDIPQNAGTIMRLCACMGVPLDIIEPCGFVLDDKRLRRAGMDYRDLGEVTRHLSWEHFLDSPPLQRPNSRLLLLTTKASIPYVEHPFSDGDILLLGRESAGVPPEVHARADVRLLIPMRPETRSINVALSGAMVLGEALRQTAGFPAPVAAPVTPAAG
ncbi:MAG: tRNA (cytidine(34)-2'-O)-methyltransferase [Rhodospirillaceae bacterium]